MWSTVALIAAGVVLLVMCVGLFIVKDDNVERRLYWWGSFFTSVLMSVVVLYRGWGAAIAMFLAVMFVTLVYAYLMTDYLKIGEKTYNVWSLIRRK